MPTTSPADAAEVIRLWPDGAPTPIEGVPEEAEWLVSAGIAAGTTFLRNISDPTLTVFTPAAGKSNGVGVIVAPGGGWTINAWTHEGLDVARWLVGAGYTAFLLKYRVQASDADAAAFEARQAAVDSGLAVPRPVAQLPTAIADLIATPEYLRAREAAAEDGRRAIEIARAEAERFGVRPETIGMIGFSAGAFLTVDLALDPRADQLAFIAPIYGGETRGASIPSDAPPMFMAVARDDILYKIVEQLHVEWSLADRPAELHVFARGQHGFGMVQQKLPSDHWTELFLRWVEDLDR
jgi:acetyl esterase/lipase